MNEIKEYKGFLVDEDFNIYNSRTALKLTPFKGSDGYMQVCRRKEDGKEYHIRVHRLFAILFIENPNNYSYVNHIDSDKTNNSISNLEWCTNSQNVKHGWDSGNRTHKNNTKVKAISNINGSIIVAKSIRELCFILKLDRHKVSRILKKELENHYEYSFYYA